MKPKISKNYHLVQFFRTETSSKTVRGSVYVDGVFICYFFNNKEEILFEGVYELKIYNSPKAQREVLLFKDSDNRFIEVHVANYAHELEGCFGVCSDFIDEMGVYSILALNKLLKAVKSKGLIIAEVRNKYVQKQLFP